MVRNYRHRLGISFIAFISGIATVVPSHFVSPLRNFAAAQSPPSKDRAVKPTVGGMEFFFDDEWVDRKVGVRRVLGQAVKHPQALLKPERPWEGSTSLQIGTVLYDEQEAKFKMWYRSEVPAPKQVKKEGAPDKSEEDSGKAQHFVCYAESVDGINWARPVIGKVKFQGSTQNNIVMVVYPGDTIFFSIVKDPEDSNPARRYKGIGVCWPVRSILVEEPQGRLALCVGYSADGINWSKLEEQTMVMNMQDLTDANLSLPVRDPTTGKWVLFARPRTGPKRRFIGYSESNDFERWTYPRMLLAPDVTDAEWVEFYGLVASPVDNWRVGNLWIYHNNPAFSPVTNELVYSRDGLHYKRAMPGHQFIPLSAEGGTFDSRSLYPRALIERGEEFFIYYTGYNTEHGARTPEMQEFTATPPPPGEKAMGRPGLARLPWGHFCGLRADLDGMIETKYVTNYGAGGVQAVAAVEPGGTIQAEILDQYGKVIPGWTRKESRMRKGDKGKVIFSWGGEKQVGSFDQVSEQKGKVGHVIKVRFYLHKATLYGFAVGERGASPAFK